MKKDKRNEKERLRKLLATAYWARENREIDDRWRQKVLARIRDIGPAGPTPGFLPDFGRFAWRLAPATLATIVGMLFLLSVLYATTEYSGLQLITNYVEELTAKQLFGT
jgi:hypothetical protein